jgi:hypothetical protein
MGIDVERLIAIYLRGWRSWTGCNWITSFGPLELNLEGITSQQARMIALATSGPESTAWREAMAWLAFVERAARDAELYAEIAISMAIFGLPEQTLTFVQKACELELLFPIESAWRPLMLALSEELSLPQLEGGICGQSCLLS